MNKINLVDPKHWSKSGLRGGEPLRTFAEMAEEFKVTPQALVAALRSSKIPHPQPVQSYKGTYSGNPHRTYYKPSEMRRW